MENEQSIIKNIPNILIVDDVPTNLTILGDILEREGYKIRPVPSGILALEVAEKEKPDLILLDIMMPDMDGYQVCQRMKQNQNLQDVPVIFISALNDTDNIVKALHFGGVDYITKPFKGEEVTARVATHLRICQQNRDLQRINAEKDKLISIIAHDLRGPLSGFMSLTDVILNDPEFTPNKIKDWTLKMNHSATNIYQLLENLLKWAQMQRGHFSFKTERLYLDELVTDCLKILSDSLQNKFIEISIDIPEKVTVFADKNMLLTVLRNLISNAIKFTPKRGKITVSAINGEKNTYIISITDTGIGMSNQMLHSLFNIDAKNRRPGTDGEPSTGLGLLLCKEFIHKHNGKIWVESEVGKGSSFKFSIPSLMD